MNREMLVSRSTMSSGVLRLGLLVTGALLITNLGLPQAITGVLVNALLLAAVEWAGVGTAVMVGAVTPLGAALRGVLPLPLLVMVPFVTLGNAVLVNVYAALRQRNQALALVVGAACKFVWLYASVTLLVVRPLSLATANGVQAVRLPETIVQMMQWPQLATALAGGLLVLGARAIVQRHS